MAHEEMVLIPVELPERYRVVPDPSVLTVSQAKRRCKVCQSADMEGIELRCLNGRSFNHNAREVERIYNLSVDPKTLRKHMLEHTEDQRSEQIAATIKAAKEFYGLTSDSAADETDAPKAKAILEILLYDTLTKVVTGDLGARNLADVLKVVSLADTVRTSDHKIVIDEKRLDAEKGASSQSIEDMYRQLGYIMDALKETVPPEYLQAAVMAAWKRGLGKDLVDLTGVPIYRLTEDDALPLDLSQVVRDVEKFGQPRSRLQLMSAEEEEESSEVDEDLPPD